MKIQKKLEAIYCSLPKPIIEALAPKSSLYQIEQGQKYAKTKFRNPETEENLDYSQMLRLHKHSNAMSTKTSPYEPSYSKTFEEFAKPFILDNNQS